MKHHEVGLGGPFLQKFQTMLSLTQVEFQLGRLCKPSLRLHEGAELNSTGAQIKTCVEI